MFSGVTGGARKRKQHGGQMLPYSPANIDVKALDTNTFPLGAENYGRAPNMFSSNVNPANIVQGGGAGFGYTTGTNANIYAGSYAPIDRNCTGCEVGARGGNNFISGGGRRSKRKHSRKGGSKKRGRKSGKNYTRKQKGCSGLGSNSKGGKGKRKNTHKKTW